MYAPIVQRLADVGEVIHHQYRPLELPGVLDHQPRRLLHDIGLGVQVVVEPFSHPPFAGVTRLKAFQGRMHLLAELLSLRAVTHERAGR